MITGVLVASILSHGAAKSLFWISVGALVVPLVSRRLRVPSAVGELLYGIAIGPHILKLMVQDDFIDIMSHLGFAILMFSAGMEIDFAPLRKRGSKLLKVAWQWVALTIVATVAGAYILGLGPWLALAVCCVSIGLSSVLLREKELLNKPLGQVVLAAGLVGETISILLLTAFDFYFRLGVSGEFFLSLLKFVVIFGMAYLLIRVFKFLIWWYPKKIGVFLESNDPLELGVRMAVALLFIFVAAAVLLGVESILGAFIAGALFGFVFQEREVVAEKFNAMGQGFFVPFFFIVVGSHFHPPESLSAIPWVLMAKLVGLAVLAKILPSVIFMKLGLNWREMLAGGLLFAVPLTLTIAVAEVGVRLSNEGVRLKAVTHEEQSVLILVAIATGLVIPFIARFLLPSSGDAGADNGGGNEAGNEKSAAEQGRV